MLLKNMLSVFPVCLMVLATLSGQGAVAGDYISGNNQTILGQGIASDFNIFSDFKSAQLEYQKVLLLSRLADARVNLERSMADLNDSLAERFRLLNQATKHEYDRVVLEESALANTRLDIGLKTNLISPLRLGRTTDGVWAGMEAFFSYIIPIYIVKDAMSMEVETLSRDNFYANDGTSLTKNFSGGNMGQFLNFLEQNKFSMTKWSKAHMAVLEMMTRVVSAADEKIMQYHKFMDQLRRGTLPLWTAPVL